MLWLLFFYCKKYLQICTKNFFTFNLFFSYVSSAFLTGFTFGLCWFLIEAPLVFLTTLRPCWTISAHHEVFTVWCPFANFHVGVVTIIFKAHAFTEVSTVWD